MDIFEGEMKALILNCSHSEMHLCYALKNRGYEVISSGSHTVHGSCEYIDSHYQIDYRNLPEIIKLADKQHVDFIVSAANDFAVMTAAKASNVIGLRGYDEPEKIEIIHHKDKFKEFLEKHSFPTPKTWFKGNIKELQQKWHSIKSNIPEKQLLIFKPVDQGSGNGMIIVDKEVNIEKLEQKLIDVSYSKQCVIEDFIEGTLHSASVFIKNSEIYHTFMVDEFLKSDMLLVNKSRYPSNLCNKIKQQIAELTVKLTKLLRLKDGLFHHQFIMSENKFYLLETTRRNPGDMFGRKITLKDKINYHDLILETQFNLPKTKNQKKSFDNTAQQIYRFIDWSDEKLAMDYNNKTIIEKYNINWETTSAKEKPKREKITFCTDHTF